MRFGRGEGFYVSNGILNYRNDYRKNQKTPKRQKEIYKRLEERGFAATNLVLGVGSYTYQYKSRDSLGFAMKATWCQVNGDCLEEY